MRLPLVAKFAALSTAGKVFAVTTAAVLVGGGIVAANALVPNELEEGGGFSKDQLKKPQDYPLRYLFKYSVAREQSGTVFRTDLTDQSVEVKLDGTPTCRTSPKSSACQHYEGLPLSGNDPSYEGACDPKIPTSPGKNTFEILYPNGKSSGVSELTYCVPPRDAAPLRVAQEFKGAFEGWGTYALTVTWTEVSAFSWWGGKYSFYQSRVDVVDYEYDLEKPTQGWLG